MIAMHKTFDFKKYVEYKVYSVTTIKKGYGFCVLLTFADESTDTYTTYKSSIKNYIVP